MPHVRDDHDEVGKVDEHVFEQVGMLHAGPDARAGDAGVDGDRDPELFAHLVHGVVAGVVDRHLRGERHDAHHRETGVLGKSPQPAHDPAGS